MNHRFRSSPRQQDASAWLTLIAALCVPVMLVTGALFAAWPTRAPSAGAAGPTPALLWDRAPTSALAPDSERDADGGEVATDHRP